MIMQARTSTGHGVDVLSPVNVRVGFFLKQLSRYESYFRKTKVGFVLTYN
jgi:hypothetical protein